MLTIILLLAFALFYFSKKSLYISEKEKEFMVFVIDMFSEHFGDIGIQTQEQHIQLVNELNKIKNKHFIKN